MVKLETELAKGVEPKEGQKYKILSAEELKTAVQGYKGVRVKFDPVKRDPADKDEYATMLWSRPEAGQQSKLGAFLAAFGLFLDDEEAAKETDKWLNHIIRIVSWKPRGREIEVVE